MKAKHLFSTAFAMLLMASCSNELPVEESGGSLFGSIPEGMIEYQFKMSGIKPTTTYATTVPLETAEMAIDSVTVIVTQIKEKAEEQSTAKIYGVFPGVRKDNTSSFQMPKKIDLGTEETDGKQIRCVIIANRLWTNLGYDAIAHHHSITTANTYADVEALLAGWMKPSKAATLITPTPVGLPMYGIADIDRPEDGDVLKVTNVKMRRPLARFDVRNNSQGSLFFKKIGLANMRESASLLERPISDSPRLITDTDFADLPEGINTFDADMNSTYQPGVFYLPPGAATDNLCLLLEAELDGITMNYTLPLSNAGGAIAVKANTRYLIDIKRTNSDTYAEWGMSQDSWGEDTTAGGGSGEDDYEHDFTPKPTPDPVP